MIFPNPNDGLFNLNLPCGNYEIRICNQPGQVIFMKDISDVNKETNFQIDVSYLPEGMYFMIIYDESGNINLQKIIIN
jgi:hypothetical protein